MTPIFEWQIGFPLDPSCSHARSDCDAAACPVPGNTKADAGRGNRGPVKRSDSAAYDVPVRGNLSLLRNPIGT